MAETNGDIQITGLIENQHMFEVLLTRDPHFELKIRAAIRKALREARKNLSRDAASYIESDPRKAAKAIKHTIYKQIIGGNLSILQKRRAGAKYELQRQRTLVEGQVGGNRRPRVDARNRLDTYYGSDRGFILRFMNSGTVNRQTRYGSRGAIRRTDWFGHTAPFEMQKAVEEVAAMINEYIKQQTNGQ